MLAVEKLRISYGAVEAVHGISFTVERGEVVALIGANGAGKTSTLAAISGLVRPRSGRVLLEDRDLVGLPTHAIVAAGVVQVPEGREILARMTVQENLLLGSRGRRGLDEIYARFPVLRERRALRLADRAHVMELGRLGVSGTGDVLLRDPAVARAYLGSA